MAYTCVYAYRKPFTVGNYQTEYWNVSLQTLLIMFQAAGYMASKFAGIKFISELSPSRRVIAATGLVTLSWLCLLGFAVLPDKAGLILMFLNGFFLGFLWGIIFSYLEGRRATDLMGAIMAVSFIFAGGFTRTVGSWVMIGLNVGAKWMPFVTGLLFLLPLILLMTLMNRLPPPDSDDIHARTVRRPMNRRDRKQMLRYFGPGVLVIVGAYLLLTVLRDIRDNYMSNIWSELGFSGNYSVFTYTETTTSVIVLAAMAFIVMIGRNISALRVVHLIIIAGFCISTGVSVLFLRGHVSGAVWMQWVGIGLYMGYIPFNCIYFERLIATFRIAGTAGFLMYFADAFGYMGSVGVMLTKELLRADMQWSEFYSTMVVVASIAGVAATFFSFIYFNRKYACLNDRS